MARVLITGASRGIGLATLKRFVREKHEVVAVGRDFSHFDVEGVRKIEFDLVEIEKIPALVQEIGDIDILVNNAGIDRKNATYDNYPEEDVKRILNVNLRAPLELMNAYASLFKERGGRVVNVASQAAEIGHRDVWYGITKAGLVNATKSYAGLLGPFGVVINAVAPGPVETEKIRVSPFYEVRFKKLIERTITERFAREEEVAEAIYWLATSSPEYINGETIDINNGAQRIK